MTVSFLPEHLVQSRLRGLYVITTGDSIAGHVQMAQAAVAGGARIVQLRAKNLPFGEALLAAREIRQLTQPAKVLFLVNDRVDLALAAHADGVHLGDDDMPPAIARRVLGPHAVIGVSASTATEAKNAAAMSANYVGTGAVFATTSKDDAGAPIGLQQLRRVAENPAVPVAAIGGVNASNIASVLAHGASMACVISAISKAPTLTAMTGQVRQLVAFFSQG